MSKPSNRMQKSAQHYSRAKIGRCQVLSALIILLYFSGLYAGEPKRAEVAAKHLTLVEYLIEKSKGLVRKEPDRYARTISRSSEIHDEVVRLHEGRIDLGPVFEGAGRGSYHLQFRALAGKQTLASTALGPAMFAWDPAKQDPWSMHGLQPGLYELALMHRAGDKYRMTGARSWVLISSSTSYTRNHDAFRDVQARVLESRDMNDPSTKEAILRACLEVLSQQELR